MEFKRKVIASGLLAAGGLLFLAGTQITRDVYTKDSMRRRVKKQETITEFQFTEDATFGGIRRFKGKLYTTYDRSAVGGKKACPT